MDRLFRQAVDLYRQGRHAEAARLFRRVAAAGGVLAAKARRYLARLARAKIEERKATRDPTAGLRTRIGRGGGVAKRVARKTVKRKKKNGGGTGKTRARSIAPAPPKLGSPLMLRGVGVIQELPARFTPPHVRPAYVRRTPHVNIRSPMPLQPGAAFDVEVYVDQQAAQEGEESKAVVVPAGAAVQVLLFPSAHFVVTGPAVQPVAINADDERSAAPVFHLAVKSSADLPADGSPSYITALFMGGGRPCGSVRRAVEIVGVAARPLPLMPSRFEVKAAKNAELQVTIVAPEGADGLHFSCVVQSHLLDAYKIPVQGSWFLKFDPEALVHAQMNEFTKKNQTSEGRIAALRGAGIEFFMAAPPIFKKAFWDLIDAGRPPKDIAIFSQEPFIPWELMIPQRTPEDPRQPLGVEFRVGRWIAADAVAPTQQIALVDSYVIAPKYNDRRDLEFAPEEADMVVRTYSGESIQPVLFAQIERRFKGEGRSLVHFVCHGKDNENGLQTIYLENNEELTSTKVRGMSGINKTFREKKPVVFLNACEVGRGAPALVGLGGFATVFIELGASAVIAPLWSVKDRIAHEIAQEFYRRIREEPKTPLAEIFRKIRERAYDPANGEDTYAAYCFYGDPAAVTVKGTPTVTGVRM
jgi:hypothetical protein